MENNQTPRGSRFHIGIFGRRNAGKSSLINALTGQETALVSNEPGTTTDPVYKSMELHPVGPVVFIDTAGFDDEGELGKQRVEKSREALGKTDLAVLVIDSEDLTSTHGETREPADITGETLKTKLKPEVEWIKYFAESRVPVIVVLNKADALDDSKGKETIDAVRKMIDPVLLISARTSEGIEELRNRIIEAAGKTEEDDLLGGLVNGGELVMLVMPQDKQAPKGRLILPQVQTIRALLDRGCTIVSTTAEGYRRGLDELDRAPDLIITDSQCFEEVWEGKPESSALTSFSILMAQAKGDIGVFIDSAKAIDDLYKKHADGSGRKLRFLIAEACTHVPQGEDIGTEKIPALLRKKFGDNIEIVNVRGNDFPESSDLKEFDLIIHCGACMFNRRHVMTRIRAATEADVPITNYGVFLAKAGGILDKVSV